MDDEHSPRLSAFIRYLADETNAAPELRSAVPFVAANNPMSIEGTGTLVKIGGEPMLVTASHCVKEEDFERAGGYQIPAFPTRRLLALNVDGIRTDTRKHDVAVVRLPKKTAQSLSEAGFYFLSTAQIEPVEPRDMSRGCALILGFPQVLTHATATVTTYGPQGLAGQFAAPSQGDLYAGYDPGLHFLIRRRAQTTNIRTGEREPSIRPQGMSGGPVWFVGFEDDEVTSEQRAMRMRWIGVETGIYDADRPIAYFKATKIEVAAALIGQLTPDLVPAMSIHRFPAIPKIPWDAPPETR